MANVLPPDFQKRVWGMYRARFLLVTSAMLLLLACIAAIALVPSYAALQVAAAPETSAGAVGDTAVTDADSLERSKFLIRELRPALDVSTSTVDVVRRVLESKPGGVRVLRVAYAYGEPSQITLVGAGSRDAVSAYRDALVRLGEFSSVSVPVGALVAAEGSTFSVILTGNF